MTLLAVWNVIKMPFAWFWYKATPKLKLVIVGCLAGLCVLGYILYLRHQRSELREDLQDANFNRQMVNVDILTNQITNSMEKGNVISQNTNQLDANRNATDRRDSNSFSTSDNEDRFCRRNCDDSTCIEWRKRHPDCR